MADPIADREIGGEIIEEDEVGRLYGKIKNYDDVKGFCFIARCDGQRDVYGHKRNFKGRVEPAKGMGVSFVLEYTDRGKSAMEIREENEIPEMILSDEGREFGTVINWIEDKGFGFVLRKKGGEQAYLNSRACDGFTPEKGMCVSFVFEHNNRGSTAKDVREEDRERVARVTAVRRFGIIDNYVHPTEENPSEGYGFIAEENSQLHGAPRRHYFHIDDIDTPPKYGVLQLGTYVSFIVVRARKNFQASDVKREVKEITQEEQEEQMGILMEGVDLGTDSGEYDTTAAGSEEIEAPVEHD